MSDPAKAVFLSYASQDAEAAKRIADALRGAGVEVWFDAEGGLEHGDEWDAKIRRQIKECVLFIPIISAHTERREEGYFRLEWDLAAERMRTIASGVAFILPVVIDGTKDADALVPDRFRSVQWTKIPGGNVPPDILQRFLKLWSHRTGALKQGSREQGSAEMEAGRPRPAEVSAKLAGPSWIVYAGLALACLTLAAGASSWLSRKHATAKPAATPVAAAAASPARDWPKDPELKRAIGLLDRNDAIPEDFRLAEEITQRVLDKFPGDPESLTAMARVQSMWLMRGWDRSTNRYQKAKAATERALQLAPGEPEAYAALAAYLFMRETENQRALDLAQRAVDLAPGEPRFHRLRDSCLWVVNSTVTDISTDTSVERTTPALERALASSRRTAELFPRNALVRYDLARRYRDLGRWQEFEEELDVALTLEPVANVIVWKARVRFGVHGDLAGMKAMLDRVPARVRGVERTVFGYFLYSAFTGNTREGLDALNGMPETWMIDFDYRGPKALPAAILLELDGKKELARLQYDEARAELQRSRNTNPSDVQTYLVEAWILHGLGRGDEARVALRIFNESLTRPFSVSPISSWWLQAIPANLLMGERATALALMREATANFPEGRAAIRSRFALDRRLAPFRDDPETVALLAEPKPVAQKIVGDSSFVPRTGTSEDWSGKAPDQKSVAVLAFANLSDDKANEYFSDGISEELLNVLAKVPGLKVTARTSSFHFKGSNTAIPEIAQQLGVAYVVEGSVRKQGDKVRITAQLIKAADGFHVWSDTFTRDVKDIFAVQDEIAGLIAKNLQLKMGVISPAAAVDPEAFRLLLAGRAKIHEGGNGNRAAAIAEIRRAVAIAPNYAAAWAELARAHIQDARAGAVRLDTAYADARAAVQRAVALEPDSPDVLVALGWVRRTADWDWRGAEQAFRRAMDLQPNHAGVLADASIMLNNLGHIAESLELGRRATELDPLNSEAFYNLSIFLGNALRLEEGARLAQRAVELAPRADGLRRNLANALADLGRFAAAGREAELEPDKDNRVHARAVILLRQGKKTEALALAQALEGGLNTLPDLAEIYAIAGDPDRAFATLERAYARRETGMIWLRVDSYLANLHSDPRWEPLLRKVGLADDQLK